jgi:transposase
MASSVGTEAERWRIVLIVVELDGSLVLIVEPTRAAVACPQCGELSRHQHSRYERRPLDLPWRGKTMRMRVRSRRWFCDTPSCRPATGWRRLMESPTSGPCDGRVARPGRRIYNRLS